MITNGRVDLPTLEEIDAEAAEALVGAQSALDYDKLDVSEDDLEKEIKRTLWRAMRGGAKPAETSAASCAVRYLAVKAKLPVVYGAGLDE